MKNRGGQFEPELGGHFQPKSGGQFKSELGGQFDRNLHICTEIKSIKSNDGETLLFNCLITSGNEFILPNHTDTNEFEDEYHMTLFNASSTLPPEMKHTASQVFPNKELIIGETKCVIINSTIDSLINLLNVGTNTALENAAE